MKVQKKQYDAYGLEQTKSKTDQQYVEVKQYALDGDANMQMTPDPASGADDDDNPTPNKRGPSGPNLGNDLRQHNQQSSYMPNDKQPTPIKMMMGGGPPKHGGGDDADDEDEDENKNNKRGDGEARNDINFDDDANDDNNNASNNRNEDEGEIYNYRNNPPPAPMQNGGGGGPPPPPPMGQEYQEVSYQEVVVEARPVPQRPKPMLPKRDNNLLNAIKSGVQLQKAEQIKREAPQDARSQMLASISQGKQLKHVDKASEPVKPKNEEPTNASIYAVLQRRKFIEDDESDESGSDWGSEED
jgi:hypothetical protein